MNTNLKGSREIRALLFRRWFVFLSLVVLPGPFARAQVGGPGNAVNFGGVNGYAQTPQSAALNAYPLTVTAWFKTTQTNAAAALVNKYFAGSLSGYQSYNDQT